MSDLETVATEGMVKNPFTAFYVGAGTDVEPLEVFPEIIHMICADGQPNSEFGKSVFRMENQVV